MMKLMNRVDTGQRGMALVLVLIVFGVGSLTIVPFLDYARTSLQDPTASFSSGSSGPLYDQYAADAGAQYAFWQLEEIAGFADSVVTTTSYNVSFDDTTEVPVTIARVETSQTLDPLPAAFFPPPDGTHSDWLDVRKTVVPTLTTTVPGGAIPGIATVDACVPNTFTYYISIENLIGSTMHVILVKDALPAGFTYISGSWSVSGSGNASSDLVSGDNPLVQVVSGQELITWEFENRPKVKAGEYINLTFSASGAPLEGTHYNHALVELSRQDVGDGSNWNYGALIPGAVQAIISEFEVEATIGSESVTAAIESSACGTEVLSWGS